MSETDGVLKRASGHFVLVLVYLAVPSSEIIEEQQQEKNKNKKKADPSQSLRRNCSQRPHSSARKQQHYMEEQ